MVENFIDSAIIIDDKEEEIVGLKSLLIQNDIYVTYLTPEEIEAEQRTLKIRKIIFLDLYLDEKESKIAGQISIIRKILKKIVGPRCGTYGIVVWSRHGDEINEVKKRLQDDYTKYTLPLFVIGLDKNKYLKNGFDNLFDDLNVELKCNIAANFFIHWSTLVNNGRDKAITNIYSLANDYELQDKNLQFILFKLAQNYTGIPINKINDYPLSIDALKSFNAMMTYEIISSNNMEFDLFRDMDKLNYISSDHDYLQNINGEYLYKNKIINLKDKNIKNMHKEKVNELKNLILVIYAKINYKLLLDEIYIRQDTVIPGNIYEIQSNGNHSLIENNPAKSKPIIIEMTPPCDFSISNLPNSRILGGFICDYSEKIIERYKKSKYYSETWPFFIKNEADMKMMVFDFHYSGTIVKNDLIDETKYRLLFRAKDSLFADILQKYSSHAARLGLSVLH